MTVGQKAHRLRQAIEQVLIDHDVTQARVKIDVQFETKIEHIVVKLQAGSQVAIH